MNVVAPESGQKVAEGEAQQLLARRLLQFGIPSLAAGASGALLMKVLGDINANRIDAEEKAKIDSPANTLVVKLPPEKLDRTKVAQVIADTMVDATEQVMADQGQDPELLCFKVAHDLTPGSVKLGNGGMGQWLSDTFSGRQVGESEPVSWLFQAPIDVGTAVVPGLIGFHLLDNYFKKREKQQARESINRIKDDYSNLLLRDLEAKRIDETGKPKTASFCAVDQLIDLSIDALEEMSPVKTAGQKVALNRALPYATSLPMLLALLSGVVSHNYALDKERELDAYYKGKATPLKAQPTRIKLVSAQEPAVIEDSPATEGSPKAVA